MKTVGRRVLSSGGLAAAQAFLDLVIRLRGDKPFLPKGVHRFRSFEDSQTWSIQMMARRPKPARQT
jgi:hypothetical protein